MTYLIDQFVSMPLELIIPFPTDIPFQSKLPNRFDNIASSSLMMQNKIEHMKKFSNASITSQGDYIVENGDKNKNAPHQSNSSFHLQG